MGAQKVVKPVRVGFWYKLTKDKVLKENLTLVRKKNRTSWVLWWLRLRLPMQGVQLLFGKLRSYVLQNVASNKQKPSKFIIQNSGHAGPVLDIIIE